MTETIKLTIPALGRGVVSVPLLYQCEGLSVGPVVSTDHMVHRRERISLALSGAIAVDMETAMLAGAAGGAPFAALRVIVDTPARPLFHPATLVSGITALRVLSRAAPILRAWAATRMTGSAPRNSRSTLPK